MDRETVIQAIEAAGLSAPADTDWSVQGSDPFFRSPLPLATGASAALVMLGSALDELHCARGGTRQMVSVDAQHAALSLLSMWLLTVDGKDALQALSATSGNLVGQYPCSDGTVLHLQPGFQHHNEAICRVLACQPVAESVKSAIAGQPGGALETSLSDAGVPAVLVRDRESWHQHPQGMAMAPIPTVEIEQIGESAPVPLALDVQPLGGLRVLDLTRVLAGPTCAKILGEHGADVLHVDSPNLTDLRAAQADTAHGKRMTFLDLELADDRDQLKLLASTADVFVQSYRAGSLARRGFGPDALAEAGKGSVYVSVNCYGHHGPWVDRPGFDGNAMAATGISKLHSQEPAPGIAVAMNDYCTAYWGAYGAIEGLRRRAVSGGSWHVRVSLTQSAMWFLRLPRVTNGDSGHSAGEALELSSHYRTTEQTAYGRLSQLNSPLLMSATPAAYARGTPMPGSSKPVWLD